MTVTFWKCAGADLLLLSVTSLAHISVKCHGVSSMWFLSVFPLTVTPTFCRVFWKDLFRCTSEELPLQVGKRKEGEGKEGQVGEQGR